MLGSVGEWRCREAAARSSDCRADCICAILIATMGFDIDLTLTDGVRVRRWVQQPEDSTRLCAPAVHPANEIAFFSRGGASYRFNRRIIEVPCSAAMIVPAGTEHETATLRSTLASSNHVQSKLVQQVGESLGAELPKAATVLPHAHALSHLATLLQEEALARDEGHALAADSLTEALVVRVFRLLGPEPQIELPRDPRIAAAVSLIEQHYSEPLTITTMAQAAGLGRFTFSHLFRAQMRVSPYRFLVSVRLAHAAALLLRGCAVTETALTVGFSDLGRFARTFRREFGCAPSAFATARFDRQRVSSLVAERLARLGGA